MAKDLISNLDLIKHTGIYGIKGSELLNKNFYSE